MEQPYEPSVLMDYLLHTHFESDLGESTVDDESSSFVIRARHHESALLNGTSELAHSFVSTVLWDDGESATRAGVLHERSVPLTLDSASNIHLFTLKAASEFFSEKQISQLDVMGVSGRTTRAGLQGHLIIAVQAPDGTRYDLDLGLA